MNPNIELDVNDLIAEYELTISKLQSEVVQYKALSRKQERKIAELENVQGVIEQEILDPATPVAEK